MATATRIIEDSVAGNDVRDDSGGSSTHNAKCGQKDSLASGHHGSTGSRGVPSIQVEQREERMLNQRTGISFTGLMGRDGDNDPDASKDAGEDHPADDTTDDKEGQCP